MQTTVVGLYCTGKSGEGLLMQIKGLGRCLRKVWELGLSGACPMCSFLLLRDAVGLVKKTTGAINIDSANKTKIKHAKKSILLTFNANQKYRDKG